MKNNFLTKLILLSVVAFLFGSCNKADVKNSAESQNPANDTLAIIAKIDKLADSLQALVSPERKKDVVRMLVDDRPLYNHYYFDEQNNVIQVEIEYYEGMTNYSILNGKIIRTYDANEGGEISTYIVENKTFVETMWNGESNEFVVVNEPDKDWNKEFNDLLAQAETKPLSEEEKKLIGKHQLRLQWLNSMGTATIYEENGILKIVGEHTETDGFVKVNGEIKYLNDKEFVLIGTVSTKSSIVNNGEVCERSGEFNFKSTKGRQYWRMQQMDNCEGNMVVDYVDIFF